MCITSLFLHRKELCVQEIKSYSKWPKMSNTNLSKVEVESFMRRTI